ncbi:MerR family DNA-binding transcriptional regulator [Rhodovulum sp. BSW8]|uniref:MerR family DNA-binding transcriptional regulator n=1 Tax=Rhodovulum visakhapatnamense TaxID=364297 RepID=A0A4R8FLD2_9RHOB|nr:MULTISPECIES: MerR family DNA-binding transcriptional regulator [Rhodovulum]OLS45707.1 MerR family transcriptional regulator [Rhodovulum sulfidophilum]MBL3568071.1 MerR family DNA-binding transcriptional regulator [Rhodovulum visakhapatnamense]MBL3577139.1 MerR family DNA-binding transcriptional regulator [Rhodovulum visakhapatnamense]RBO52046.1 MerR family DNA-binding transcriptional regulator [Rhodovulum sp. BSW8]TDX27049.1 MerR family transcriptional regulator [Rhodovulum visakhapatnamen
MTDELMTIRQMCDAFEVTARTLRFYESKELISPLREGQRRLYGRRDRARLKLILRGKRFGFSLEEIRQMLDLYDLDDGQETQFRRTCELARERLAVMERQRLELDDAISELKGQISWGERKLADFDKRKPAAE